MSMPTESSDTSSAGSELPSRELLFGEIDSTGTRSLRTNNSICNLTFSSNSTFLKFWLLDEARESFLACTEKEDLANLRLVCHDFSNRVAPYLFNDLSVSFKAASFTRPSRLAALERIGYHVNSLHFNIPHGPQYFLPPLIDPYTGEELVFEYTPQVHSPKPLAGQVTAPKYGSWELTDLLVKQYPPLFHASTNVPSFIRFFNALSEVSHIAISCPNAQSNFTDRRSIVDYTLISIRIAMEQASLLMLNRLTLSPIHPTGLLHLQPVLGFGTGPKSAKRWRQIEDITIHMDSADFGRGFRSDHLKSLHAYLRNFSVSLKRLRFRWNNEKGPCPLSLETEPGFGRGDSPDSAVPSCGLQRLRFKQLQYMELENAVMDASQISKFICRHRRTLKEFNFENIKLRSGNWDEALEPLSAINGRENWTQKQGDVMEVPLMLSKADEAGDSSNTTYERGRQERAQMTLSRWLSTRAGKATLKAKEQLCGGSDHMKKLLRCSILGWR